VYFAPLTAVSEPMLMTRPPPAAAMAGMSSRQKRKGAVTFTAITRARSSVRVLVSGADSEMPALFTNTRGVPAWSTVRHAASTAASSATSTASGCRASPASPRSDSSDSAERASAQTS
jgi:hypothetical protein